LGVTAATSVGFTELRAEVLRLATLPVNPHRTGLWHKSRPTANGLGMTEKDPKNRLELLALTRHSAVSWIEQSLNQGNTLGRALALAAELDWDGRRYSPRTLEDWFYVWRAQGFGALERQSRRDKGICRAISPQAAEAIVKLRLQLPSLPISVLVRELEQSAVLEPGTFSLSSVYRLLVSRGLDRPRLIAEGTGPTKAFETDLANTLWMSDVMDGPTLRVGDRTSAHLPLRRTRRLLAANPSRPVLRQ
jgi:hypothetical protein